LSEKYIEPCLQPGLPLVPLVSTLPLAPIGCVEEEEEETITGKNP